MIKYIEVCAPENPPRQLGTVPVPASMLRPGQALPRVFRLVNRDGADVVLQFALIARGQKRRVALRAVGVTLEQLRACGAFMEARA